MIQFRARHGARYFFLPSAQTFETFARNLISPSAFTSLETGERESLTDSCSEERRKKELLELSSIARYVEKETVWRSG